MSKELDKALKILKTKPLPDDADELISELMD